MYAHSKYFRLNADLKVVVVIIIIITIITSLFREDDILSNTNYLSDTWSSIIKIMYLNHRQFVQCILIQYENVQCNI